MRYSDKCRKQWQIDFHTIVLGNYNTPLKLHVYGNLNLKFIKNKCIFNNNNSDR